MALKHKLKHKLCLDTELSYNSLWDLLIYVYNFLDGVFLDQVKWGIGGEILFSVKIVKQNLLVGRKLSSRQGGRISF